ncbi:MAG: hypothetical protein FJ278_15195, partial [Planctomycetes bacterium]|nr:hypothetical protein [Planctomycetota bacterium]
MTNQCSMPSDRCPIPLCGNQAAMTKRRCALRGLGLGHWGFVGHWVLATWAFLGGPTRGTPMRLVLATRRHLSTLIALLLACGGCGRPERSDILVVGLAQTVVTLDPAMHRDRTTEGVLRNIFDGLVTRSAEGRVVPEMAESWRLVDERTWEFRLRPGIRFHDGSPFTAEDVKFTIDRIITDRAVGGRSSPRRGLIEKVVGAEVVDPHTVRIRTSEPFPPLINMLPFIEIVPTAYVQRVGDAYFAEHPVGAGPFQFVEWRKAEHIILKRFDGYYGGAADIPPVGPAAVRL